ncbi:MAG: tetratricopeptide repeat protein [Propionicimonas sp.]|uniref:serine/threonine-protein kinase n=1 Tax=Propionicimonas sp. TaxID=1955623 RepID=UPI003D0BFC32
MKCRQPGCTGTIVDGYCDVCGMPGVMPVGRATPGNRPSTRSSGPCRQPGCPGHIVDGYCDVCGSPDVVAAPAASPSPASTATRTSIHLGSTALGSARATSFGGRPQRQTSSERLTTGRIGAGLTRVPPAPEIDPAKAVLANPEVPLDARVCPRCGAKVGQGAENVASRSEGFCPSCGAPYSFTVKLKAGDVVAGQYEVVGALAHGGMGWIYLAKDRNVSGRWVVLKGLLNAGDADAVAAAIGEQRFLARVEHPQIVEIYNFVTHDDAGYIVMEYVGGRSLKQLLKQRMTTNNGESDPLPAEMSLAFLIEILPALGYLHSIGLLYCDFKPDNVIQVGDALKLIDLGGVRHIGDEDSAIYGTVGFQAPEVATLGPSIASDIFTVGRTLMVLSAEVPGYQTEYETRIPPAEEMPAFAAHDSLYRLLLKCCAPDPNDRFTSTEELRLQMLGVLREVVAAATPGVGTISAASVLFEAPTVASERTGQRQLPRLRPDPTDPQAAWLARISTEDPIERLAALESPPALSADVLLARGEAALDAQNPRLVDDCVRQLLTADPWEWRAVWLAGIAALQAHDFTTAQSSFNAVYGQVPGELAPKLALALACELGGELDIAENLYRVCASTDAAYVTPAAFGLARVRAARNDLPGSLAALELVPSTSRGYPESQRLKVRDLVTLAGDASGLDEAFRALGQARLEPRVDAEYRVLLLRKALDLAAAGGITLGGRPTTAAMVRDDLVAGYRELARLTENPGIRAGYVDLANSLRPWSLL